MGYTTDFSGKLKFNKQLSLDDHIFLTKFANTRRMARNVDAKYGVEGEFYVDGTGMMGQGNDDNIIDHNRHPRTQPGLWCQWVPTEDGWYLEWDGNEKFYDYVEWLQYLISKVLEPRGYVLNGEIDWSGEEDDDQGTIVVLNNEVSTRASDEDGEKATRVFFVVDGPVTDLANQNDELFETLEQAEAYAETVEYARIRICIVRHAFKEVNGLWNYDDNSDTFEVIKTIKGE